MNNMTPRNFDITVYKRSTPRFMSFLSCEQCAAYLTSTRKLSPSFYLAGSDLIFDRFRICCSSDSQASLLSQELS